LVALAQSSQTIQLENLSLPSSAPKLGELSSNITLLVSPDDPWYIKASARINYDKIFDSLSPINNKLSGARVKPFLINSALPVDVLGKVGLIVFLRYCDSKAKHDSYVYFNLKIWELSDLDQDGQLDRDEFLIVRKIILFQIKFCTHKIEVLFYFQGVTIIKQSKRRHTGTRSATPKFIASQS
jgi:hypothetical protein